MPSKRTLWIAGGLAVAVVVALWLKKRYEIANTGGIQGPPQK
jgi:hypothetical protein